MGYNEMDKVWDNSQATKTDKLVLLAIARRYKPGIGAWPSQEYLAKICGVDKRSIRNSITRLEALDELKWVRGSNLSKKANLYWIKCIEVSKTSAVTVQETSAISAKTSAENDKNFRLLNKQINKVNKERFFDFLSNFPNMTVDEAKVYRAWTKAIREKHASEDLLVTASQANREMLEPDAWLNFEKWRSVRSVDVQSDDWKSRAIND
jgi:hypothetical protein